MSSSLSTPSPLVRLVLFMICLSIAGTVVAGAHYFTVDLPQQKALPAPANGQNECEKSCNFCFGMSADPVACYARCVAERQCTLG